MNFNQKKKKKKRISRIFWPILKSLEQMTMSIEF